MSRKPRKTSARTAAPAKAGRSAKPATKAATKRPAAAAGGDSGAPRELEAMLQSLGRRIIELPFEPMAISATDIRRRLAAGQSTRGLLDAAVARYIAEHRLYRTAWRPQ